MIPVNGSSNSMALLLGKNKKELRLKKLVYK